MSSVVNRIAIELQRFLEAYEPEITYAPDFNLRRMQTRRVCILPLNLKRKFATRSSFENDIEIQVGYIHKCPVIGDVALHVGEVEEIGRKVFGETLADFTCMSVDYDPLFSVDELKDSGVFVGVVSLVFRRYANDKASDTASMVQEGEG